MFSRVFYMIYSVVLLFSTVIFVPHFAYSQDTNGSGQKGKKSSKNIVVPSSVGALGDINDPLDRFYKRYSPTSDYLQSIDPSAFEADYRTILRMVSDLDSDLIPALVVHMDGGAWGVFREYARDSISSKYRFVGQSGSYFQDVAQRVASGTHLTNCVRILEKAFARFEQIKDSLGYVGFSEEEVLNTEYKINRALGILCSFFYSAEGLRKAKSRFDFILNGNIAWKKPRINPIVKERDQIAEACRYNSGISYALSKFFQSDDILSIFYRREELFYLWNLIGITIEDPQFRDSQYMRICKDFLPVMDVTGARFHQHYAKYVGILGLKYSKPDSETEPVKQKDE